MSRLRRCEWDRYGELILRERADEIANLTIRPRFPLCVRAVCVGFYSPSFAYTVRATDESIVEDCRPSTPVVRLERALFSVIHEVRPSLPNERIDADDPA